MAKCSVNTNCAAVVIVGIWLLAFVGCGKSGVPMVPVTGTVTVKGKPLQAGRIFFEPAPGMQEATSAVGEIADGHFTLHTKLPGDGVAIGKYYPVILDPKNDDERRTKQRIGVVQLDTTVFEVTESGNNEFEIEISAEDLQYSITDD